MAKTLEDNDNSHMHVCASTLSPTRDEIHPVQDHIYLVPKGESITDNRSCYSHHLLPTEQRILQTLYTWQNNYLSYEFVTRLQEAWLFYWFQKNLENTDIIVTY